MDGLGWVNRQMLPTDRCRLLNRLPAKPPSYLFIRSYTWPQPGTGVDPTDETDPPEPHQPEPGPAGWIPDLRLAPRHIAAALKGARVGCWWPRVDVKAIERCCVLVHLPFSGPHHLGRRLLVHCSTWRCTVSFAPASQHTHTHTHTRERPADRQQTDRQTDRHKNNDTTRMSIHEPVTRRTQRQEQQRERGPGRRSPPSRRSPSPQATSGSVRTACLRSALPKP
eukprot:264348-Rhodomonas_salina.1